MILTKQQLEDLKVVSEPLIKWINDNGHPHMSAIVTSTDCELVEGIAAYRTYEFVKD